ncbi:hypothetical protein RvY_11408 [Ramazzottius varieornatus]|uniref:Secreted protein n=1 Tax=Ramazzottius varieornatus TaxID=947166 RepID=A0A1D1VI33_RAMVA|nr:hypothetical protein RvY_11408 [Ramazzottius varieornatus]
MLGAGVPGPSIFALVPSVLTVTATTISPESVSTPSVSTTMASSVVSDATVSIVTTTTASTVIPSYVAPGCFLAVSSFGTLSPVTGAVTRPSVVQAVIFDVVLSVLMEGCSITEPISGEWFMRRTIRAEAHFHVGPAGVDVGLHHVGLLGVRLAWLLGMDRRKNCLLLRRYRARDGSS